MFALRGDFGDDGHRRMAIPALDSSGLLPPGVHNATLDEVETMFGLDNSTRIALFQGLKRYAAHLRSFELFKGIYIDGSFTTDKPDPGDIDAVVDLHVPSMIALLAKPNRDAVLNGSAVKLTYGIHQFFAPIDPGMISFFQHLRPEEAILRKVSISITRGILRIPL